MQPYQSVPCPHCGATWNTPDALYCQQCQRPLAVQPPTRASKKPLLIALGAILAAGALAELVVLPAMAAGELTADQQAVAAVYRHQPSVDAAMAAFLTPHDAKTGHAGIGESFLHLDEYRAALATIHSDQQRVQDVDSQLGWMSMVALTKQGEISHARRLNQLIREALHQAEGATVAEVDQGTLMSSINDILLLFDKELKAAEAKDFTTAVQVFPEIDQKLKIAEGLVGNPDMPNGARSMVQYLSRTMNDAQAAISAAQSHYASDGRAALASLQADVAASKQFDDAFFRSWDAWNVRNLQPIMNAYHDALRQARAST